MERDRPVSVSSFDQNLEIYRRAGGPSLAVSDEDLSFISQRSTFDPRTASGDGAWTYHELHEH